MAEVLLGSDPGLLYIVCDSVPGRQVGYVKCASVLDNNILVLRQFRMKYLCASVLLSVNLVKCRALRELHMSIELLTCKSRQLSCKRCNCSQQGTACGCHFQGQPPSHLLAAFQVSLLGPAGVQRLIRNQVVHDAEPMLEQDLCKLNCRLLFHRCGIWMASCSRRARSPASWRCSRGPCWSMPPLGRSRGRCSRR